MSADPNLLPTHLLRLRSRRRRVRRWHFALVLTAALSGASVVYLRSQVRDPDSATREAIAGTVAQIDLVNGAVVSSREQLQSLERQLAVAREVSTKPDWSILVSTLAWQAQGKATLSSIQLDADGGGEGAGAGYRLSLQGISADQSQLTLFVEGLESTGLFARVKATQTQSVPDPETENGELTAFTIDARIREGG